MDESEHNDDFIENRNLEKGMLILLKNHPCKIISICFSKCGKHGVSKMLVTGVDIFTEIKYEDILISHNNFTQFVKPIISSYLVTNLDGIVLHTFHEKYNNCVQIELSSNNLCNKVLARLSKMMACDVKILSHNNLHKLIEVQ